ncbi:hypothetical protein ACFV6F_12425 [Kitasatospora phosalacinea]|uniref:hypothetical protein n=1 Tax=Kitasatospora phosalacinea TaxID=2065 RepID=UPI003652A216
MHEERLAAFSRERLDGRPLPDDLRTLLVAQWEGRDAFTRLLRLDLFAPGETHPLLDTDYLSEAELADPEMQCINAAAAQLAAHLKLVARGGRGWVGYWLHPDEPADRGWRPAELDTEFSVRTLPGRTLAEAAAAELAHYRDESDERAGYAALVAELAALGLPLDSREYDALDRTEPRVDPEGLMEELIEAERGRRGLH